METKAVGFFSDGEGDRSMGRLVSFLILAVIFTVWSIACYHKMDMLDFPSGVLYIIGMILSYLLFHKGIEDGTFGDIASGVFTKAKTTTTLLGDHPEGG